MLSLPWTECPVSDGLDVQIPWNTHEPNDVIAKLNQRDAQIDNLQKRVQELEQHSTAVAQIKPTPTAQPTPHVTAVASAAPAGSTSASSAPAVASQNTPVKSPAAQVAKNSADPNPFDVGEDAEAQRALERTLVISGALLVPYGQFEVQPGFTYQHYSSQSNALVSTSQGITAGTVNSSTNDMIGSLYARMGLPWESQLEVFTPYQSIEQQSTGNIQSGIYASNSSKASGIGDVRVGLAKTLLTEKDWWPDVIARVSWQSNTGQVVNSIPLGTGYDSMIGSMTLTKRQDPLVFFGTASYQSAIATTTSRPGDNLSFTLGTILAASPETSLRAFLNQNFVSNYQVNGQSVSGSNMNISTLNLGASTILGRGLFLDFTAGVGLTSESPDYTVGTSLAYRFDLPFMPGM